MRCLAGSGLRRDRRVWATPQESGRGGFLLRRVAGPLRGPTADWQCKQERCLANWHVSPRALALQASAIVATPIAA
jgi:hypothetical protein